MRACMRVFVCIYNRYTIGIPSGPAFGVRLREVSASERADVTWHPNVKTETKVLLDQVGYRAQGRILNMIKSII